MYRALVVVVGIAVVHGALLPDATAQTVRETRGTKRNDTFNASSNRVYYGLQGNDTFRTRDGNANTTFIGGSGNDRYSVGSNASAVISDVGGGRDTLYASSIHWQLGHTSYSATYDGKHFIAWSYNNNSMFIVLNHASSANRIETYRFADATLTHNQIVSADPSDPTTGYVGDLTWSDFRRAGIEVASSFLIDQAVKYHASRSKKLEKKKFADDLEMTQAFGFDGVTTSIAYRIGGVVVEAAHNTDHVAALEQSAGSAGATLVSQHKLIPSSATDALSVAVELPAGMRLQAAYSEPTRALEEQAVDPTMLVAEQTATTDFGFKLSVPVSEKVMGAVGFRRSDDENGFLGGTTIGMQPVLAGTAMNIATASLAVGLARDITLVASYSHGLVEPELRMNPLFSVRDRWEVAGYSFAVSKSSIFTKSDILSFGLMRPLGIIDGSVDYLLPTYFGDEGHAVDVSQQSTPFVVELGYSHATEFARLGGSLSYTMNDTGVGGEENFAASLSLGTEF